MPSSLVTHVRCTTLCTGHAHSLTSQINTVRLQILRVTTSHFLLLLTRPLTLVVVIIRGQHCTTSTTTTTTRSSSTFTFTNSLSLSLIDCSLTLSLVLLLSATLLRLYTLAFSSTNTAAAATTITTATTIKRHIIKVTQQQHTFIQSVTFMPRHIPTHSRSRSLFQESHNGLRERERRPERSYPRPPPPLSQTHLHLYPLSLSHCSSMATTAAAFLVDTVLGRF